MARFVRGSLHKGGRKTAFSLVTEIQKTLAGLSVEPENRKPHTSAIRVYLDGNFASFWALEGVLQEMDVKPKLKF